MSPKVVIDMPFGDRREVIVRRGTELEHSYGLVKRKPPVVVSGLEFDLVTYEQTLSPPVFTGAFAWRRPGVSSGVPGAVFAEDEVEAILGRVGVR